MPDRAAFELFLREQRIDTLFDEPLAPHTTFRCGGRAQYLIEPKDPLELAEVVRKSIENGIPFRMLGAGACLLVGDDGVDGVVLRLRRFRTCEITADFVKVEGGYDLPRLVKETTRMGLTGLQCLAGVPGSIGGSLIMNAGGRHGEIGERVRYVDVMDLEGRITRLSKEQIDFHYRGSSLRGAIVLGCGLQLEYEDPETTTASYNEILRDKKATQPLGSPNAGCVFKNPVGQRAGKMIEECGLKGARIGRAHISKKHANFIINDGGCQSSDVLRLIDLIRAKVRERFDAVLELEIYVW